nr:MAG TPA: hypothetical protein [Caudoviricetes sp.]
MGVWWKLVSSSIYIYTWLYNVFLLLFTFILSNLYFI